LDWLVGGGVPGPRRPVQVSVQKVKRPRAAHAVAALKKLDLRALREPELRVEPTDFAVFVRHPLVASHAVEMAALERLNNGVALCARLGDNGTRELLENILVDEEGHVDWLETQLETIRQIGVENYLAQQLGD